MKTKDLLFGGIIILCFLPFFISESFYNGYTEYNGSHPYIMAFFKFAILATLGEVIGLRIKKGIYNEPGFGILPRAIIWGFLGMWIAVAMKTFSSGVPYLLQSFGIEGVPDAMKQSLSMEKVFGAFFISVMMNTTFGPVFMTLHKITDT